ncbi:MAG: Hpt domain-containing protein [Spirochaetes bacterium]|nr:Hpt domain-containing protein [Spirochaetota bacterium]
METDTAGGGERPVARVDAVLRDLIPEYLQNRRLDVAKLRAWGMEGRGEEMRRLLHQMKGSGGMYGFPRITELARAMEARVAAGEGPMIGPLLGELEAYVDGVVVEYVEE